MVPNEETISNEDHSQKRYLIIQSPKMALGDMAHAELYDHDCGLSTFPHTHHTTLDHL